MGFKDDKTYKSFKTQMRECVKSKNIFTEKCMCGHELIMCKKHGGQCMSYKCLEERTDGIESTPTKNIKAENLYGNTSVFYPRNNNR